MQRPTDGYHEPAVDSRGMVLKMTSNTAKSSRFKLSLFACAVLAFGLLLWARFLLVTDHPRTAIAQPPAQQQLGAVHSDQTQGR
jgi:hypothetical protein